MTETINLGMAAVLIVTFTWAVWITLRVSEEKELLKKYRRKYWAAVEEWNGERAAHEKTKKLLAEQYAKTVVTAAERDEALKMLHGTERLRKDVMSHVDR
jgi:hypothetical protein